MKKNAFTLIELLAVIVILAIVALIATPIILGIIRDAKEQTNKRSVEMYADAIKNAIVRYQIKENKKTTSFVDIEKYIEYEGGNVVCDTIEIYEDGNVYLAKCKVNGEEINYTYGKRNIPEPESFATDSWETIVANINSDKYKVGDTREIELKGFENGETDENGVQIKTYTIRIANKTNTGDVCTKEYFEKEDGTKETYSKTACGFVIEFVDIITTHNMNPAGEYKGVQYSYGWNVDGYPASSMYTFVNNDIYNSLPEDLKSVIIDTTVVSGYGSGDAPNKVTTDKVYLLSTGEVWEQGTSNQIKYDTARENTRQLDYYKDVAKVTTTSYSGAIKKYNGNAYYWWLRSAYSSRYFYSVLTNGCWRSNGFAYYTDGVAVAFRIG